MWCGTVFVITVSSAPVTAISAVPGAFVWAVGTTVTEVFTLASGACHSHCFFAFVCGLYILK